MTEKLESIQRRKFIRHTGMGVAAAVAARGLRWYGFYLQQHGECHSRF